MEIKEKDLYAMLIGDVLTKAGDTNSSIYDVVRVPGGWIYRFYQPKKVFGVGNVGWQYECDSVFVPKPVFPEGNIR